jgi:raffinose/stachyose/melibiose transport system substrate-binding protein
LQVVPILYLAEQNAGDTWARSVAANQEALDADGSPFVEALEAYEELQSDGCFNGDANTATLEQAMAAVLDGSAAMVASHSNMLPRLLTAANGEQARIDQSVAFVPVSETNAVASFAPGPLGTFFAPKTGDASKEAAALEFIRFTTGPEYQQFIDESGTFPLLDGFSDPSGVPPLLQQVKSAYDSGATLAFNTNIPGFNTFPVEMNRLLNGEVDAAGAASNMQGQLQQAAQAAGLDGW